MTNGSYVGAMGAGSVGFDRAHEQTRKPETFRRAARRVWGVVCGASFLAVRASIYLLIVLPLAAVACLAGIAVYAAAGGNHG